MRGLTFLAAGRLWLLLALVALIVAYLVLQRKRRRYTVRFTNLALLDRVAPRRPGWRRHVPAALFVVALALMTAAWARPATAVKVPRDRATIMVAIDVSPSMRASDVRPTRMEAEKQAARKFVRSLPARFNVGLVAFGGSAAVLNSPTQDHQAVIDSIGQLQYVESTAIGEAVFTCLQAIRSFDARARVDPPPAAIVLLSDGDNTRGRSIGEAIDAARAAKVPVSTIAYGTLYGEVTLDDGSVVRVAVNRQALRALAQGTGGHAYQAGSAAQLDRVYENIGTSLGYRVRHREVTARFVGLALLFALTAAGCSLVWFGRLP